MSSVVSPRSKWAGMVALALSIPALVLALTPATSGALELTREGLHAGEWWRLLTCHWTHWSVDHLVWDLAAFGALGLACGRISLRRLLATVSSSALAIALAVGLLLPEVRHYRGLSGVDSALFVLLAVLLLRRTGDRLITSCVGLALLAFVAKIGFELCTGGAVFVEATRFAPVPLAHVVGGACGLVGSWGAWPQPSSGSASL